MHGQVSSGRVDSEKNESLKFEFTCVDHFKLIALSGLTNPNPNLLCMVKFLVVGLTVKKMKV